MPSNKKRIFLFSSAVILGILTFALFYYRQGQSSQCYNGVHDTREAGVDCGGVCSSPCVPIKNIRIVWTKAMSAGEGRYNLVAFLENPNSLYGASQFAYQFKAFNGAGKEIAAHNGESFLLPGEEKYLFAIDVKAPEAIHSVSLDIKKAVWQQFSAYQEPTLLVINKKIYPIRIGKFRTAAEGRLLNDSIYNLRTVNIKVILFGKNNELLAVNTTFLGDVKAHEKRDFRVFWDKEISPSLVKNIFIQAEANIFKENSFIKDYNYQQIHPQYDSEKF